MIFGTFIIVILAMQVCRWGYTIIQDYIVGRRIDIGMFLWMVLFVIAICAGVFYRMVRIKDSTFYERIKCSEYQVITQVDTSKNHADTTFTIKYKPL